MLTDEDLQKIQLNIQHYQNSFAQDGQLAPMQLLKQEHCIRVAENSLYIAQNLQWQHCKQNLAQAIGFLHDIARFEQWQKYATFSDKLSEDHGDLGANILLKSPIIKHLSATVQNLIIHSVRFHNKKDIPSPISQKEEEQLLVIREADRLDIIFVIIKAIEEREIDDHPQILWNADLHGPVTPIVYKSLEQGEAINYAHLQTLSDWILLHLQWIQQLSFPGSYRLVHNRDYLGRLHKIMPDKSTKITQLFNRFSQC